MRTCSKHALNHARRYSVTGFGQRLIDLYLEDGGQLDKELLLMIQQNRCDHVLAALDCIATEQPSVANDIENLFSRLATQEDSRNPMVAPFQQAAHRDFGCLLVIVERLVNDFGFGSVCDVLHEIADRELHHMVLRALEITIGHPRTRQSEAGVRTTRLTTMAQLASRGPRAPGSIGARRF